MMRYCMYCGHQRLASEFKNIYHAASNSNRGQCGPCQQIRKSTPKERKPNDKNTNHQ